MCNNIFSFGACREKISNSSCLLFVSGVFVVALSGCMVEFEEKDFGGSSSGYVGNDSDADNDGGGRSNAPADDNSEDGDTAENIGEDTGGDSGDNTGDGNSDDQGVGTDEVFDENHVWFGVEWEYRRKIVLLRSQVAGTHSFFPVVISTSLDSWRGSAHGGHVQQSDGGDFVFTGDDGTSKLDHEIEEYDSSTGKLVVWVKIPEVSSSEDTVIYAYYGNADANLANQWSKADVWDDGGDNYFKGVWHISETSTGNREDSTQYANNCSCLGCDGSEAVDGKIGGADRLDGTDDWLDCGQAPNLNIRDELTISAWMKPMSTRIGKEKWVNGPWKPNSYGFYLYGRSNTLTTLGVDFKINGQKKDFFEKGTIDIPLGVWSYLVVTYDGSDIKAYVDGQLDFTISSPGTVDDSLAEILTVSETEKKGGLFLQGGIDEMRVSGKGRSSEWIKTCFNNQKSPNSFYSIKDEVAR